MGCCYDRDLALQALPEGEQLPAHPTSVLSEGSVEGVNRAEYKPLVQPQDSSQVTTGVASTIGIDYKTSKKPANFTNEARALQDRKLHVLALMSKAEHWNVQYEQDYLLVKFMAGSKFAANIQVSYFYIDFEVEVEFEEVLAVLENCSRRQEWDESILALEISRVEETEYETCYTKYQLYGLERDFVERRHRTQDQAELLISFYSVTDDAYPHSDIRGTTYLGYYRLGKTEAGTTDMLLFTQMDFKLQGEVLQRFTSRRGDSVKAWLEEFKTQVKNLIPK